jgi:hypothetical protein
MTTQDYSLKALKNLQGKSVYLGIRRLNQTGSVISETSHRGTITQADPGGIEVSWADGQQRLPPAPQAFHRCPADAVPAQDDEPTPELIAIWQAEPAPTDPDDEGNVPPAGAIKWTWMKLNFPN